MHHYLLYRIKLFTYMNNELLFNFINYILQNLLNLHTFKLNIYYIYSSFLYN